MQDLTQCYTQARVVTVIIKKTSPTTSDQSYNPKSLEAIYQTCPPKFEQSLPIIYPPEDSVQESNFISMALDI